MSVSRVVSSVLGVLVVGTACTVDRVVPLEDFACETTNSCDAGMKKETPRDGGFEAVPLAECPGIEPISADGIGVGSTADANNGYEGGCFPSGGKDLVFGFDVPGRLWFLEVSTAGSNFDTTLHFYENDCDPRNRIVCTDETETDTMFDRTSRFRIEDFPAGRYAAIVDGFGPEEGDVFLRVTGAVAPGETCDPRQEAYFPCLAGACGADPAGGFRCPPVLDCADTIDADRDGLVDEDADKCNAPPTVSCSPGPNAIVDRPADPSASVVDDGQITHTEWTVEDRPLGSYSEPYERYEEATTVLLDLAGTYRMRYLAIDDARQASACEVTFNPTIASDFRMELIWSPTVPRYASNEVLFAHLLHPLATAWFDEAYDCGGPRCFDLPVDWDNPMDFSDDPLWVGFIYGPQRIFIDAPTPGQAYAIGVETADIGGDLPPPVDALVRIFCGGVLMASYGPTLLQGNYITPDMNDFWKVAEVQFDMAGNCMVTPYGNGTNVVVPVRDAAMMR